MATGRHPTILSAATAQLLVVDVQPRLSKYIPRREQVIANTVRLLRLAAIYQLPVGITEQNAAKLGPTEGPIAEAAVGLLVQPALDKLAFSACATEACQALTLRAMDRPQVILTGTETHICILQTALDLVHQGRQVHLVTDAVGARSEEAHANGLARMAQAGVILTNWESVVYEVAFQAGDDKFRRVLDEIMKADIAVPVL